MKITYHGGNCCGIKTIVGFYYAPSIKFDDMTQCHYPGDGSDQWLDQDGDSVCSDYNCYCGPSLADDGLTYEQVFDKMVEFIKDWRPSGIIEVVINDNQKVMGWGEVFEKRGFRLVSKCYNSNSGNNIYVYHLCVDIKRKEQQPLRGGIL